jgi:hypothetical protein
MTHHALGRRGLLAVLASVCMLAVPFVATADASKKSEAKQNAAIKKNTKNDAKLAKTVKSVAKTLTASNGRIKAIEAAAPGIASALTGLQGSVASLNTLFATAAPVLTALGQAYPSVEFGRAAISAGDADLTIAAGGSGTSADIPDDGNAASVDDDAIVVAGAGATTETIDLRALIRSAEGDKGASDTAGQAGGFLLVTNLDTGARVPCTGAPNPPGILGTPQGASIVTPSGTVTNLPLKNIPGGNERTSTVEPTGANGTDLLPVACSFTAAPGTTYQVHWSVQFLDIPTTSSPGPTE